MLVVLSVLGSVGFFSAVGIKSTLIIMEVIPFLVLAVSYLYKYYGCQSYLRPVIAAVFFIDLRPCSSRRYMLSPGIFAVVNTHQ